MDDINEELTKKLTETLEAGVSEDTIKHATKLADEIAERIKDDVLYGLKDSLAANLAHYVEEMAAKTVESLLEGNEGMMCRYLKCEQGGWNGRSDGYHWGNRKPSGWHPVIHGKLFEQGCVALRKQIVEAHRDLLVNQRILDLEDQVKSLVVQVNEANEAKEKMWERFKHVA